ncbi:CmpA/NrtA family ABC transporter substrate-binding protein [Magnetospira sp. QH-2]|uniref:CmpA/NrtA family ABC transporter substrate-binding protein n=1 Tax=Magnetospira sp. (strain QH-2) TaxID=1288970 RepID=UPI0003E817EB|nr:CmpA/NrtA family ABC transporter substrate-binding protein [Magnetospira sp. QH-2]CCQ74202.1 Putative nitrate ABC transporter (Substrate-binding protein) (ntrA-like protein) [Magnetospira sp. QH-2]
MGAFANPFDPDKVLWAGCPCGQHKSLLEHQMAMSGQSESRFACETIEPEAETAINTPMMADSAIDDDEPDMLDQEAVMERAVESAVLNGIFGNDMQRRTFLQAVGAGTAAAAISQFFPLQEAKAAVLDNLKGGPLEKKHLNVGFVPITCATPIIMAHPMGFYKKYGLDVDVIKTAGWAVARDKSLSGEYDAAHMLTPMPLSITMGAGSTAHPWTMPAIENINGQAITLANKHKDKRDPKMWKGFKFAVPFEYSMHNFLLRYYVAEHGLDPDKDIQIRVLPPPEMVANLRAGNVDGYLSPDPFNQRAVYDGVGFLHALTKEIWSGHPCCAFASSEKFIKEAPNTFLALFKSILEATAYSSNKANRAEIAKAISPKNYLNQPETVVKQVLTGRFADGLGKVRNDPDRIDFDPFPWHSMGIWIMTQMKRWGYVKGDVDYKGVAEQVYLATDAQKLMTSMGQTPPDKTYDKHTIMGKEFDPSKPEAYVDSFAIKRG